VKPEGIAIILSTCERHQKGSEEILLSFGSFFSAVEDATSEWTVSSIDP